MTACSLYRTVAYCLAPLCASPAEGAQATELGQDTRRGTAAARALAAQGFRACRSDGRRAVTAAIFRHPIRIDGTNSNVKVS